MKFLKICQKRLFEEKLERDFSQLATYLVNLMIYSVYLYTLLLYNIAKISNIGYNIVPGFLFGEEDTMFQPDRFLFCLLLFIILNK